MYNHSETSTSQFWPTRYRLKNDHWREDRGRGGSQIIHKTYRYHFHMQTDGEGNQLKCTHSQDTRYTPQDTKHYPPHLTLHSSTLLIVCGYHHLNNCAPFNMKLIMWSYTCETHKCNFRKLVHTMLTWKVILDWCFCTRLPQRPACKSWRLRGQEPQQTTPEKVVGSVAMPPRGALPLRGPHSYYRDTPIAFSYSPPHNMGHSLSHIIGPT